MEKNIVLISTTVATHEQAEKIAQDLLRAHLAACIQIQEIGSHYWENDQIKKEREVQIIIKTSESIAKQTCEELLKLHPYDIPEIIMHDGKTSQKYHDWLEGVIRLKSRYYKE